MKIHMEKLTQEQIVSNELKQKGFVSTVWAFHHQILRLSEVIRKLKRKGWVFDCYYPEGSKNYHYRTLQKPN